MLKRFGLLVPALWSIFSLAMADEGMWLPWNLGKAQVEKMQKMGLVLTPEAIFSSEMSSLKDAVVALDSGSCTGSFISHNGLLLTNHHCAFSEIQKHSTLTNDYLKNGFWAHSPDQELPNPGKTASILLRVEDVTPLLDSILLPDLTSSQREKSLDSLMAIIIDTASQNGRFTAEIKDFYFQNQFFLFVSETFRDVRLVAAPPAQLGQFGDEADNWMWPRHSADFALFRVYAAKDGTPSEYSPENIPYHPKKHLSISLKGVENNDFTMILGYPGETQRFLTSFGIQETSDIINPVVNEVRSIKQKIWKNAMETMPVIDIQYADKYASSSNYQKYASGQNLSIQSNNLTSQRERLEQQFETWINLDSVTREDFHQVLSSTKLLYLLKQNLTRISITTIETLFNGPDVNVFIMEGFQLHNALSQSSPGSTEIAAITDKLRKQGEAFFRDFNPDLDRQVFEAMLTYYQQHLRDSDRIPNEQLYGKRGTPSSLAESIYKYSIFSNSERYFQFLKNPSLQVMEKDPGFQFMIRVVNQYAPIYTILDRFDNQMEEMMQKYVEGLKAMQPDKNFYPDANSTLRLTFGKVAPYSPRDGVLYKATTSNLGLIEKFRSNRKSYQLPDSLLSLYQRDDYGRYKSTNQTLPLCFISNNDITGGNSGSAVLNANGQVVGLAFDGNWEGMSSDLGYVPTIQRCVSVDIRYVLFLIEELGGATHLLDELSLVD